MCKIHIEKLHSLNIWNLDAENLTVYREVSHMTVCLFVCFTPLTHFAMQSKGGSCEGDSLPSFPKGPTCKVNFACPP